MKLIYFIPVFPKISETFITREVIELSKKKDINLTIVTWGREELDIPLPLKGNVIKYEPDYTRALYANLGFLFTHPYRYFKTLTFFIFSNHESFKGFAHDILSFFKSVAVSKFIEKLNPDHIHTHFLTWTSSFVMGIGTMLNIPYSLTTHAFDLYVKTNNDITAFATMKKRKMKQAKFVVTVTDYNKQYILRKFDIDENKIKVIRIGVDEHTFDGFNLDYPTDSKLKILQVGRFTQKKGHEYTIEACHKLQEKNIDFECNLIGVIGRDSDQKYFEMLERRINKYGLRDKVFLRVSLPFSKTKKYYEQSHVLVVPSVTAKDGDIEGLPTVIIEAYLAKRPVIATNHSGIPEIVIDRVNGFLVQEKDVSAITKALIEINNNRELAYKLALKGRETVLSKFNIEKNVNTLTKLFTNNAN